jgi:superfamily I DNA/RNA helicase/mRNA-degrading endonuclease RelE of RelBE toxin-antitoxin system
MNINVAISKEFLKAKRQLPEKIQRRTEETIDEFQHNPRSSGLNYEPLNFMDDKLRSIRVSQDYRIIMGQLSDLYCLLYVDHHDQAYRWAERKEIDYNRYTNAIQIVEPIDSSQPSTENNGDSNNTPQEATSPSPIAECTDEQLLRLGVPQGWVNIVRWVRTEEGLYELIAHLPEDVIENLEFVVKGHDVRDIIRDVEAGAQEAGDGKPGSLNERRHFYIVSDDAELKQLLQEDFEAWRVFLHPQQRQIAYGHANGPVKVTGGAGTGKTVAAIHRAQYLARQLAPDSKPVFFTTYTNNLIHNLQRLVAAEDIPEERIYVKGFFSYVLHDARRREIALLADTNRFLIFDNKELNQFNNFIEQQASAEVREQYSAAFLLEEWREVVLPHLLRNEEDYLQVARRGRGTGLNRSARQQLWPVFAAYADWQRREQCFTYDNLCYHLALWYDDNPGHAPFSHLICDELQDFNSVGLQLMRRWVPEGPNDLFLVGDPFQNIYGRHMSFADVGINIRGRRSRKLRLNYRTTAEIHEQAVQALSGAEFYDFDESTATLTDYTSVMSGPQPEYRAVEQEADELAEACRFVNTLLETDHISPSEICIAASRKSRVDEVAEYLTQQGLPTRNLRASDNGSTAEQVAATTFHGMKGLEFKAVCILDVGAQQYPKKPRDYANWTALEQERFHRSEQALLYVVMTRAVNKLMLTGVGAPCSYLHSLQPTQAV